MLDGREIEKSERIKAVQDFGLIRPRIIQQQEEYRKKREEEGDKTDNKEETKPGFDGRWYTDINDSDKKVDAEKEHQKKVDDFWQEKVPYTPESRLDVHEHLKELKEKDEKKDHEDKAPQRRLFEMFTADHEDKPPQRRLFADDGRPFNINESNDQAPVYSRPGSIQVSNVYACLTVTRLQSTLDLAVFRHLDTSLMDCDVQPNYVRVTLKGKVFQLCLTEEVNAERSTAKRSQTTGHLLIIMPKAKQVLKPTRPAAEIKKEIQQKRQETAKNEKNRQVLEVDSNARRGVDISSIVTDSTKPLPQPLGATRRQEKTERPNSENFVDNPDVPPLM
ncbi:hypothetical protein BaRGS_00019717 [Batillaria attramentaria]|uniref:Dynein axonemal assembly factor 11-like CS domain-containing protein n=1 Tax=Batillaria attramentaria TaxID=370345 RepID=A0ABD0KPA4_9CAEN